ncbi:MAG: hypothetical protein JNJ45_04580 [Chthonomonas sp.]|nr:hypothetical protein [Chthonomonas sp.]
MKLFPAVLSLALVASTLTIDAQPRTKRIGRVAETALVGIPLYSPGLKVINKFGPPDDILAITLGTGGGAGGAGGGGGGGEQGLTRPPKGGGAPAGGGSPGSGDMAPPGAVTRPGSGEDFIGDPFSNVGWRQANAGAGDMSPADAGGRDGGSPPLPGGPGGGNGGSGGGGSTTATSVQFTKWVYKRKNARYSFVIDKFNRVVQIEAIGINDPNVRTSRGIKFGDNFKTLSNKYFQPDGYDLAGDSFVVKYLQRGKVAFRFSRMEPNKPHVITGIVVAAGK